MNLLAGTLYDPAVAVNKVTTALLAMTALDTANLRHSVTVPPSGRIMWEIEGTLHGAATLPQIMLGVMEGANVRGRAAPMVGVSNPATTSLVKVAARGIITGLTPGATIVLDAAYGVETLLAATGLKYGGPNNATANDNFGGLFFALFDPSPIYTPSAVPAIPISTRLDTLDDFVDTEIAAIIAALVVIDDLLDTEIAAIKAKTDGLPADPADASDLLALLTVLQADTDNIQSRLPAALVGGRMASNAEVVGDKTGYALTVAEHAAVADKLLGRNLKGGSDVGRKVHEALAALRNRWAIAAGVLTIYDTDDATPLFTAAVTRTSGDPVSQVDPV